MWISCPLRDFKGWNWVPLKFQCQIITQSDITRQDLASQFLSFLDVVNIKGLFVQSWVKLEQRAYQLTIAPWGRGCPWPIPVSLKGTAWFLAWRGSLMDIYELSSESSKFDILDSNMTISLRIYLSTQRYNHHGVIVLWVFKMILLYIGMVVYS